MFGSDHPSLPYERIFREGEEIGYADTSLPTSSTATQSGCWGSRSSGQTAGRGYGPCPPFV